VNGATIDLLYFARVAELIGKRTETWPLPNETTSIELLKQLQQHYPQLESAARLRLAVNQEHVRGSVPIRPGDEVAVFEPVTGG